MNEDIYSLVMQKYRELRKEAEKNCIEEIDRLYAVHPKLKELNDSVFAAKSKVLRAGMKHLPEKEAFEKDLEDILLRKEQYIKENNIDTGVFTIKYTCPDCSDTGRLPDGSRCHCFADYFAQMRFGDEEMKILERENFTSFDSSIFPEVTKDGLEQRKQMEHIRSALESYCASFPNVPKKNIIISGLSGTGKSFLLNCITKAFYDRKVSVIKISAYKLISELFNLYISDSQGFNSELERLSDIDVLVIDDLGTELMKDNFTLNTLYFIFDRRIELDRATIVSTNLSPRQLEERYSDRIMSRLFNRRVSNSLLLNGTDVRVKPNA